MIEFLTLVCVIFISLIIKFFFAENQIKPKIKKTHTGMDEMELTDKYLVTKLRQNIKAI